MIKQLVDDFFEISDGNYIREDVALDSELNGMQLFDKPIIGIASANDPIFETYSNKHDIMYQKFIGPKVWLKSAKSVVSIFLPYSEQVKTGNANNLKRPSLEWLHGRYEGQKFINELSEFIKMKLEHAGHKCVIPSIDDRLDVRIGTRTNKDVNTSLSLTNADYWSSWSERHVAFAAGLGTFGLSKNIITRKGSAGRLTSIIIDIDFKATERPYTDVYEYCTFCGQCISNCPVNAIHINKGKEHTVCSKYIDWVLKEYYPRYACGKCQVKVPCQDGIPETP